MPSRRLRFVHAANVLLDEPLRGFGPVPDSLRACVRDATQTAFQRLVDVCLKHQVDFLLLTGNTFVATNASPRTFGTLRRGLLRLAESDVLVLAVPGQLDPPDAWNRMPELPDNLTLLDAASEPVWVTRDDQPVAAVQVFGNGAAGPSRPVARPAAQPRATQSDRSRLPQDAQAPRPSDQSLPPDDVFFVGVLVDWDGAAGSQPERPPETFPDDGTRSLDEVARPADRPRRTDDPRLTDRPRPTAPSCPTDGPCPTDVRSPAEGPSRTDAAASQPERLRAWCERLAVDYLAVCNDDRHFTVRCGPRLAHNPGGTQAWTPQDTGAHGATLVDVQDDRVETKFVPTGPVRCESLPLSVDFTQDPDSLVGSLLEQMQTTLNALQHHDGETLWLLEWVLQPSDATPDQLEPTAVLQALASLLASPNEPPGGLQQRGGVLLERASRELTGPEGVVCLHRLSWSGLWPVTAAWLAVNQDQLASSFGRLLSEAFSDPSGLQRRLDQRLHQVAPWAVPLLQQAGPTSAERVVELAWRCGWQWLREAG